MIIGLSGKARVGKDTVADYLVTHYGFERCSFAIYLKSIAKNIVGWDGIKDHRGRKLLQDLGTVVRQYDPTFWIRPVVSFIGMDTNKDYVITDVRHFNEAEAISNLGGFLVRINRDEATIGELGNHESEIKLDSYKRFDLIIDNNGGFDELFAKVSAFVDTKLTINK